MEQNDSFAAVIADFNDAIATCSSDYKGSDSPHSGHCWSRRGWNGPGQFIQLAQPDGFDPMTFPYVFIHTVQGHHIPWLPSQGDMLARDWYEVEQDGVRLV
jgi:hypothetical protein